jgi:hypothetical protein
MPLRSKLLKGDHRLQSCLVEDASHVTQGMTGPFVGRIQDALFVIDGLKVERSEQIGHRYGASTATAVLDYKTQRNIINPKYQSRPDNIVGKMTIAALDRELLKKEFAQPTMRHYCGYDADGRTLVLSNLQSTLSLRQNLAFSLTSSGSLASAPTTSSPATVAKSRAPGARRLVQLALGRLEAMIHDKQHPKLPQSPIMLASFDALWRNFGMPVFPKNNPLLTNQMNGAVQNLDDYLNVVKDVLKGMEANLANAANIFNDVPMPWYPKAHAFTVAITRKPGDPPASNFPDGIYFNQRYLTDGTNKVGPLKQMEVALHECGHLVQNDNIADIATQTISWAYGYSNFVLFCALGREVITDTE